MKILEYFITHSKNTKIKDIKITLHKHLAKKYELKND